LKLQISKPLGFAEEAKWNETNNKSVQIIILVSILKDAFSKIGLFYSWAYQSALIKDTVELFIYGFIF
jgi:hypothetical protein